MWSSQFSKTSTRGQRSRFSLRARSSAPVALATVALGLASVGSAQSLTWTTAVDQIASSNNETRQLRALALAKEAGDDSIYLGYIQHHTPCSRDVHRHSTVAPHVLLDTRGLGCPQPKGLDTDDRGFVYVGNREGGGSFTAVVHVHDAELNLLDTFNFSTGEFGGIAVERDGSDYYLYLTREGGGVINRYVATDPTNIVPDTSWGTSGSFTVPGGGVLRGIKVASDGTLFVAQRDPGTVFRISADLSSVTSAVSPRAMDVALFGDRVYASAYDGVNSLIRVLDAADLSFIEDITVDDLDGNPYTRGSAAGFAGIEIDAGGRIWLADEQYAGSGIATQDRLIVSSTLLSPGLALNTSQACQTTGSLVVTVDLTGNGAAEVWGGQFFLEYDDSVLQFVSAAPDPTGPFPLPILLDSSVSGELFYAVGVGFGDPPTTGNATMATLTFNILAPSACDVTDVIEFVVNATGPSTYPTDGFGQPIPATLTGIGTLTFDATAPTFATFPADTTLECTVSMVNIAGTQDMSVSTYRMFDIEPGVLFQPLLSPVRVTGWVDIGGLPGNSSVFMQLMSKDRYDAWDASSFGPFVSNTNLFGFNDQAHVAANTANGGRIGIGQQISFGSVTQNYAGGNNLGPVVSGFEAEFGATQFSLTMNAQTTTRTYENKLDYLSWASSGDAPSLANATNHPLVTDWSSGAYAAVGTFSDNPVPSSASFDVTFSQSVIPDPAITGEPTASDNCDPSPTITYVDAIVPGACPQAFTIERIWTATDACGNSVSQVQTISIVDTTPPVIVGVPSDITVPADAGFCNAVVFWTPPTATDNCTPAGNIIVTSSHDPGDVFPVGDTTVTYWFEDECGNASSASFEVEVLGTSLLNVTVELEGVSEPGPITRCIEFQLECGMAVTADVVFSGGVGVVQVAVPCYVATPPVNPLDPLLACVTARDPKHTLREVATATVVGTEFEAEFVASNGNALRGGNANGDGFIDILDFGVFAAQFGQTVGPNTPCGHLGLHADFSGDGFVDSADFSFIQINFLKLDFLCSCPLPLGAIAERARPLTRVRVSDMRRMGYPSPELADLNGDGWIDSTDVALFFTTHILGN